MGQQEQAADALRDQPIWVQDLLAWLEKIQQQDLTVEEWVRQVQDVLAELPGEGLPKEFCPKKEGETEVEESVDEAAAAELPPLSDEDRARIGEELNNANSIVDEKSRSEALVAIATQIPASEPQLLEAALEAAKSIKNEYYRPQALAAVFTQLPANDPQLLEVALEAAKSIEDDYNRSLALTAVAAQLPANERQLVLEAALNAAKSIADEYYQPHALVAVAAQLPASEPQLFEATLEAVKSIAEYYRSPALAAVAAQLPANERQLVLEAALEAAKNIEEEYYRSRALATVAVQLPASKPHLLEAVFDAAKSIEAEQFRSPALAAVAAQLPASERQPVLQATLEAVQRITDYQFKSQALAAVFAQLPASEPQLLEAVKSIEAEGFRSQVLAAVFAKIPTSERPLLEAALDAVKSIEAEQYRAEALAALAAQIPTSERPLLEAALEAVKSIKFEPFQYPALAAIAAQIPASECPLLEAALEAAKSIKNDYYRSLALTAVAAQLPANERQPVLEAALEAAKSTEERYRPEALAAIAVQLPTNEPQLLKSALEAAKSIESEGFRSQALAAVAVQLPASERPLLEDALDAVKSIESEDYRSYALAAVAVQLPASERPLALEAALDAAKSIEDEGARSQALGAVFTQLPASEPQLLQAALESAKSIKDEGSRSYALAVLAAQLPASEPQLLEATLKAAGKIEYEQYQSEALGAVFTQIPPSEPQLLQAALNAAKSIEAEVYRSEALSILAAQLIAIEPQQLIQSVLVLERQGDRVTVLRELAFRNTEALLLHVPPTLLATFLRIIPEGKTAADRARLLSALAPKLSPGLFPRALQLVQTKISHPAYQAEILANLAPYLPIDLLAEALTIVQYHIPGYSYPTIALCALIPHLSLIQLEAALVIASERVPQPPLTSKIFQAVATRLSNANRSRLTPEDLAQKDHLVQYLLRHIQQHIHDEKSTANLLTALAPSLDSESLNAILSNILPKLTSEFYRAQALAAMATVPNFTTQQLTPCGEKAMELSQPYPKATALSALIPHFLELHADVTQIQSDAPTAIQSTDLALILATRPHTDDSAYLSLLTVDQTNALRLIREQPRDPDKANSLVKLAPHLCQDLLLEAQSVVQDIQDRYHQARSLLALATHFPEVRAEALTQISSLKAQAPIQHIELLSQYTITVPEQIPTLLKAVEDWAKNNPFKDDPKEPDPNTFKRRRILIALKPHLPLRLDREIDRQTGIGRAPQDLWERALFVLRTEYRRALKSGTIRNDVAQDSDLLNLKEEINALTEMLLMRDLEPPVAVGILGGWGGGKSYIMHLMQTHMVMARSQGMEPIEAWGLIEGGKTPDHNRLGRFVGHIYQIKFDAWTYAKADLWSSLMQTIFFELDRQISLEMSLRKIGIDPLDSNSSEIWRVLYQTTEDDRQYLLEKALGKEKLSELKKKNKEQQESWTSLLWEQYGITETDAKNRLSRAKEQLDQVMHKLNNLEQKKTTLNEQLAPDDKPIFWFVGILEETSNISGFLLRKYFGKEVADDLQAEIENRLKSTDVDTIDTSDLSKITLFINESLSEIIDENQITLANGTKRYSLSWLALRKWANKNRQLIITVVILLGCAILGPLVAHQINPQNTIAQLSWLITPLVPAISLIQNLLKSHQRWLAQAQQSVQDYQTTLKERSENKFHNLISEKQANELRKLDSEINQLRNQQRSLEQEITQAQNDLPSDKFASLASFVNATVKGERYDRELGIMHQVKTDLSKLSQSLLPPPYDSEEYKNKLNKLRDVFPRGPARVVLFIDDLDRCPPDTVVEVLEAVQLLVKNPLFIAVLAIDERYINRALAKHYKDVLSLRGRPSAADYLEKIIQIPYRIRPIDETALRNYLRAQVVVQDSETSGTKFNEFSPQEFNLLVQCCQEAELSPRSLKRLTNVYKLYKVLSRTRGHRPTRREQKAILALLAFSSRYPDLMRDIIEEIGSHYEEGRHLLRRNGETETLAKIINTYLGKYERLSPDSALIPDVKKLRHDVEKLLEEDLELKEIRQIFDFVRSFSFVGDIGTDYTPSSIFSQTNANFEEGV